MADIEALRARMRCDVTGNLVGTDTRMIGAPPCGCQGCRADAEITRLRDDLDRVTRERDEARASTRILSEQAHDNAVLLLSAQERAEAAEAALAKRDEEVARLKEAVGAVTAGTSAYLPPDGISARECIDRIIAATDNSEINTIMGVGNGNRTS